MVLYTEKLELFNKPFLKRLRMKPFYVNPRHVDHRPKFQTDLFESLMNGWQRDQAIIVAASDDPTIDGIPIQGLNRVLMLERVLIHNPKYDLGRIPVYSIECKDWRDYKTQRANFERLATLSKDPAISKLIVKDNITDVIKADFNKGQPKITEYFDSQGFTDHELINEIYQDLADKLERARQNKTKSSKKESSIKDNQPTIPSHLQDRKSWGLSNQPEYHPIIEDDSITHIRDIEVICEHCGKETTTKINVIVSDDGKKVKVLQGVLSVRR